MLPGPHVLPVVEALHDAGHRGPVIEECIQAGLGRLPALHAGV